MGSAPVFVAVALLLAAAACASPAAAQVPVRGDTVAADTLPPDSTLTVRERALRRLRAMPLTPIQPDPADTVAVDTVAEIVVADSLPAAPTEDDTAAVPTPEPIGRPPAGQPPVEEPPAGQPPGRPIGRPLGRPAAQDTARPGRPVAAPEDAAEAAPGGVVGGVAGDTLGLTDEGVAVREDSVRALLRALAGYQVTEYRGEAAVFSAEGNELRFTGASRVQQGESAMEADSVLVYSGDRGVVCGYGNPVLSGESDPVESDRVCFDIERNLGEAVGARTKFVQGATWYVRGAENRVYLLTGEEQNKLYGEKAEFTSCELEDPHYTFRARSLKMVEGDLMVARDVTLRFEDVPVFWLPWMVQSMKRDRRSGLLMPEFGVNDIVRNGSGYNRHLSNIGFYWAINDYLGARGTFEWYSDNWTAVEGALSYYWRRQFLRGSWAARQYWREGGRRDLTVNTNNSWEPDERTRVQLNGSYATSTDFVRENSFSPTELNRRITSSGSINRTFDWGAVSLGAQRNQDISTEKTDLTLPSFQLNLQPITLFANEAGTLGLTWSGSGNAERKQTDVQEALSPSLRDQDLVTAGASHSLTFGRLSLSQSVQFQDETLGLRYPIAPDSAAPDSVRQVLLEENERTLNWSTSLGYQQNLWTGTTLTPSVSIGGNQIANEATGGALFAAPNRLSAGATLATTIFGFWPGFADFSRIRHKISPSLRWQYSPTSERTLRQEEIFGTGNLREQNRLTLSFNQTFEAKIESDDTAAVDSVDSVVNQGGEPRRLPSAEKVMLLSINTSGPFVYDFVSAREEDRGFLTDRVSNSLRSDLLRDLSINMSHDLFEEGPEPEDGGARPRTFKPFLTSLNASFRIDQDFWLFRLLGLTGAPAEEPVEEEPREGVAGSEDPTMEGEMYDEGVPGVGGIVPGRRGAGDRGIRGGIGGWQASLNYSLDRFRAAEDGAQREAEQTLGGNMSFQPTEHWSLRWSTSYSFTAGEFSSHMLTLTRDLHRWQANFDFIKAQNGNFLFTFRVQLTDNPDLKLDYDQRTDPSDRREAQQTQNRQTQ